MSASGPSGPLVCCFVVAHLPLSCDKQLPSIGIQNRPGIQIAGFPQAPEIMENH